MAFYLAGPCMNVLAYRQCFLTGTVVKMHRTGEVKKFSHSDLEWSVNGEWTWEIIFLFYFLKVEFMFFNLEPISFRTPLIPS